MGELAPGVDVVGLAGDSEEATRLIIERRPDVAVLDCRMMGQSGAEVATWVREQDLPTRVLALSAYDDERHVHEMLQAGAAGYVLKDESPEAIVEAIETVARGGVWYSQPVACIVAAWAQRGRADLPTEREAQVLCLLAKGYTNACIAKEIGFAKRTVAFHMEGILSKLGVCNRTEAVVEAIRRGWIGV